jgi:hypothetical protein
MTGEPQSPSVYACHGARWAISRNTAGGWLAQQSTRPNAIKIISADTEATLITALDAAEAGEGNDS